MVFHGSTLSTWPLFLLSTPAFAGYPHFGQSLRGIRESLNRTVFHFSRLQPFLLLTPPFAGSPHFGHCSASFWTPLTLILDSCLTHSGPVYPSRICGRQPCAEWFLPLFSWFPTFNFQLFLLSTPAKRATPILDNHSEELESC